RHRRRGSTRPPLSRRNGRGAGGEGHDARHEIFMRKQMPTLDEKYARLQTCLRDIGSVLVAFSGGVDSTVLLKVAYDTLGDQAVAATADSETYPREELGQARDLAALIG